MAYYGEWSVWRRHESQDRCPECREGVLYVRSRVVSATFDIPGEGLETRTDAEQEYRCNNLNCDFYDFTTADLTD